ncbi:unnamed protein product [Hydatigera taeniaeformis]|uniref:Fibronectin type-III domain-containing protein n=1 Tax=Hydatigena taeniaeformis TaxID=6205 RepID=A0A0R3XB65_HYDTA|nr:unnamed protein product [Hydatigera taeniaeformis]
MCTIEGLHFKSMYRARVKAHNQSGYSAYSDRLVIQTSTPPSSVEVGVVTSGVVATSAFIIISITTLSLAHFRRHLFGLPSLIQNSSKCLQWHLFIIMSDELHLLDEMHLSSADSSLSSLNWVVRRRLPPLLITPPPPPDGRMKATNDRHALQASTCLLSWMICLFVCFFFKCIFALMRKSLLRSTKRRRVSVGLTSDSWFHMDASRSSVGGLQFSNSNRSLTCQSMEDCVALASTGLSRGIHYWEFVIDRLDAGGQPSFGIAKSDCNKEAMLGMLNSPCYDAITSELTNEGEEEAEAEAEDDSEEEEEEKKKDADEANWKDGRGRRRRRS